MSFKTKDVMHAQPVTQPAGPRTQETSLWHSPPVRSRKKQANMFSLRRSSSSSRRKGGKRRMVLVGVVAGG